MKKAQLKIQEMSFMLVALMLFFMIVLLVFVVISSLDFEKAARNIKEEESILLITKLADGAELNYNGRSNSVDADKLVAIKNRIVYQSYWPLKSLVIKRIYPYLDTEVECVTGKYEGCNMFSIVNSTEACEVNQYSSYISICRREFKDGYDYDKCELGIIIACPEDLYN